MRSIVAMVAAPASRFAPIVRRTLATSHPGTPMGIRITPSEGSAHRERHRKTFRAVDARRRLPGASRAERRADDPGSERGERLLQLGARERRSEAEVRSVAEGEMWQLVVGDGIEGSGARIGMLVVVGAPGREEEHGTDRKLLT